MKNKLVEFNCYLDKLRLKYPVIMKSIDYIIYFLVLYTVIRLFICYIQRTNLNITSDFNSPEIVTIIASILGATVGGIITYFVTTRSLIKSNHIKSAVINKKTIYEPLYIEFKELLKEISEKDVIYLSQDSAYRTIVSTQFEVWTRIKKDSRIFQIPEYLKRNLLSFEEHLLGYINHFDIIDSNALEFFEAQLEDMGHHIEENKSEIKSFLDTEALINRQEDYLKTYIFKDEILGVPNLSQAEIDLINNEFNTYITNNKDIEEHHRRKNSVIYYLNDLIKILELIIIRITNNYEKQSNLY
ncbi:hypothetical protein [Paenibacillus alvei]|uniref:Uncharacterized protein n=1 Tax=Paenibacillus alvei TaxID=44250 RepID=A0A383REK5_PAEAL|nr:hypothetical protein [Paenibacillus alvei]SYX85052.1 conserved protein of unknown function [Paenibacillus alvei]